MFLTTAAPLRRGSTPLPVKHQLRREEAISEDCDWIPGLEGPATVPTTDTAVPRDDSFSQSAAAQSSYSQSQGGGVLRIVLLGQNGVGKSSLALSLAGQSDRSLSIDSETQACGKELMGWVRCTQSACSLVLNLFLWKCSHFKLSNMQTKLFWPRVHLRLICF